MRPTFVQLETFYWIGRLGSVKEAARHLHVAPPTISLRIDQLEAELGNSLFERAGRGVTQTRRGEALMPQVASVVEEYARIRTTIEGSWQNNGILRIGVIETFAQWCLPDFMQSIISRHPALQLELAVGTSADLERRILERKLDVAFAVNPIGDAKMTLVPLGIQPVTWAAAASYDLPSPLHPSDLRGVLVISNPYPAPMWQQITDWFRQAGLEPPTICRCSSPTAVANLVASGLGASLLPHRLVEVSVRAGKVHALQSKLPLQPSRLYAVYRHADGGALIQDVVGLGRDALASGGLLETHENRSSSKKR